MAATVPRCSSSSGSSCRTAGVAVVAATVPRCCRSSGSNRAALQCLYSGFFAQSGAPHFSAAISGLVFISAHRASQPSVTFHFSACMWRKEDHFPSLVNCPSLRPHSCESCLALSFIISVRCVGTRSLLFSMFSLTVRACWVRKRTVTLRRTVTNGATIAF